MNQFVVMCPCCVSPVDVEARQGPDDQPMSQTLECVGCGQTWTMSIDPARMAEYSNA